MIRSVAVRNKPNDAQSVFNVPSVTGVRRWRANNPASASAGIARPKRPIIIATAVVRL